ncbi:MAG: RHS repeat-associated core domain-containing protein [Victivallaceae bacterium]|nr:RHS repeat-associated core domain-containing protein [Victivallaceae bacterium]
MTIEFYTGVNISAEYVKTLGYDTYGRLNSVSDGTDTFTYAYLANSNLVSGVTRPNNLTTDYSYEANRNLMTVVENKYNATTISAYTYRYDNVGKRNDVVNTGTAFAASNLINWTYNDRSELLTAKKYNSTTPDSPTNAVTAYDYALAFDNIGNRSSYNTSTGGTATTYTLNNLNQYTAAANPTLSLTYDTDGNMLTAGSANGTWNGENRLIEIYDDTTGKKVEFVYDYMGRRVEKKVYTGTSGTSWTLSTHELFVYDGYKCIEVLDGANSNAILQKFLWGGDGLLSVYDTAATATYYYFADANKNIGQLMDSSGNTVAKYEYSPFGVQTLSTGAYAATNPFRFSSEYYDSETELVYYNYRYYSPALGKWLSRDPIGERGGSNLYAMVNNNPVDYWDKLGLKKKCDCLTDDEINNLLFLDGYSNRPAFGADDFLDKQPEWFAEDVRNPLADIFLNAALNVAKNVLKDMIKDMIYNPPPSRKLMVSPHTWIRVPVWEKNNNSYKFTGTYKDLHFAPNGENDYMIEDPKNALYYGIPIYMFSTPEEDMKLIKKWRNPDSERGQPLKKK